MIPSSGSLSLLYSKSDDIIHSNEKLDKFSPGKMGLHLEAGTKLKSQSDQIRAYVFMPERNNTVLFHLRKSGPRPRDQTKRTQKT
jgi:hypothetical protein